MDITDETVRYAKNFLEAKGYMVLPVGEYERDAAAFIALDDELKRLKVEMENMVRAQAAIPAPTPAPAPPAKKAPRNWREELHIDNIMDWCAAHPGEMKYVRVSGEKADVENAQSSMRRFFNNRFGRGCYDMTTPDGNSFRIGLRRSLKSTRGPVPPERRDAPMLSVVG